MGWCRGGGRFVPSTDGSSLSTHDSALVTTVRHLEVRTVVTSDESSTGTYEPSQEVTNRHPAHTNEHANSPRSQAATHALTPPRRHDIKTTGTTGGLFTGGAPPLRSSHTFRTIMRKDHDCMGAPGQPPDTVHTSPRTSPARPRTPPPPPDAPSGSKPSRAWREALRRGRTRHPPGIRPVTAYTSPRHPPLVLLQPGLIVRRLSVGALLHPASSPCPSSTPWHTPPRTS